MHRRGFWPCLLVALASGASAQALVAEGGRARTTVVLSFEASPAERYAAEELAHWLGQITNVSIPVQVDPQEVPANAIVVGGGAISRRLFPAVAWDRLGLEETVMRVDGRRTLLAGGRPRGTVYSVYRLLHRLGCRWWTPWAETIPKMGKLTLPRLNLNETPAFESRDSFWYSGFDGDWAARNATNGQTARLEAKHGGRVEYAGFVHTFYPLVPPDSYFRLHPEWYSLIDGKRTATNAQLCTTDPHLRDFVVERVRERLRQNPQATIVSVSQNDCFNPCQCDRCQALVREQDSESAPVLALANYVAERIEKDYPHVAVDTLAYQYTRKAPRTLRPRPNVIVRLCSIECNFSQPLTHPSNASFADDIRDWSRLTGRLYIWNYDTNFAHYPQPIPNYFVLGPNERFFRANGVRGVFEQGAYQSNGGEMAELRAWVQARLLWDPSADDKALIDEFLKGYYGPAAKPIRQHLDLLTNAAKGQVATIYDPTTKPFFGLATMRRSEELWQRAERLVAKRPDLRWRVRQGHLAVRYVWLSRWNDFRAEARRTGTAWPLPESRKQVADEWLALATDPGPVGWTPITHVNESGNTPQQWVSRFAVDPVEPPPLPGRPTNAPWPAGFDPAGRTVVDVQDEFARLANAPDWATLRADAAASDGIACRMPGDHHEWAFQIPVGTIGKGLTPGRWRVMVVARTSGSATSGTAFTAGVYDDTAHRDLSTRSFDVSDAKARYRTFDIGTMILTASSYVWVAPPGRSEVESVWIDRVLFVRD